MGIVSSLNPSAKKSSIVENTFLQKYLLSCSAFDPWSTDRKNIGYIILMISVAWFIPLVTITGCYLKVNDYLPNKITMMCRNNAYQLDKNSYVTRNIQ